MEAFFDGSMGNRIDYTPSNIVFVSPQDAMRNLSILGQSIGIWNSTTTRSRSFTCRRGARTYISGRSPRGHKSPARCTHRGHARRTRAKNPREEPFALSDKNRDKIKKEIRIFCIRPHRATHTVDTPEEPALKSSYKNRDKIT